MVSRLADQEATRGQIIIIFPFLLIGLLLLTRLVIDGGYGFGQRRAARTPPPGAQRRGYCHQRRRRRTRTSRLRSKAPSRATEEPCLSARLGQWYVDKNGAQIVAVGGTSVPSNAAGVRVPTSLTWSPFMARLVGMNTWSTTAVATARGVSNQAPPRAAHLPGWDLSRDLRPVVGGPYGPVPCPNTISQLSGSGIHRRWQQSPRSEIVAQVWLCRLRSRAGLERRL